MKKTKSAVSALVLAIAAVGISFVVPTNSTNDTNHIQDITKAVTLASEEVFKPEYSGVTLVSSSFVSVLNNYENTNDLEEKTGITLDSTAGLSVAFSEYSSYIAASDDTTVLAAVEALDVATKMVPEGSVIEGYTNLGVSNVDSYLNVRKGPGTDQKIVGKMPGSSACEILEEENGWYKVKSGEVTGYVSAEFILTGYDANIKAMETMEEELLVTGDVLNVREEASTDCSISTSVRNGEYLEVVEDEKDGWYKVNINNLVGYVSADYVKKVNTLPVAVEIVEVQITQKSAYTGATFDVSTLDQSVSQTAKDLIEYAMQFLGNPYVYGGNSLTNGTDCSGFTKLIFAQFGYNLPRSSSAYTGAGTVIPYASAKPGDIMVYKYGSSIGHVAIYIGNGQIVHASTPSGGIRIGSAYFVQPYCAVRIIP